MVEKVILIGEVHTDLDKINRYLRALRNFEVGGIALESPTDTVHQFLPLHIPESTHYPPYLSLCKGADIATHLYQQQRAKNGKRTTFCNVDIPSDELERLVEKVKRNKITPVQQEVLLQELYCRIILANACGMERINKIKEDHSLNDGDTADLIVYSFQDLAMHGSTEEIEKATEWSDCMYLLSEISEPAAALGSMESRDTFAAEQIIQMEGAVAYLGGAAHVYGSYNNLYQQLKDKRVPVERFRLVDFICEDQTEQTNYLKRLELLAVEVRAEAQSILREL